MQQHEISSYDQGAKEVKMCDMKKKKKKFKDWDDKVSKSQDTEILQHSETYNLWKA